MSQETRTFVGNRIRELRKSQKLSQQKLALMVNVERSYLAKIEGGKRNPSLECIEKISKGLGLSLEEFFKGCSLLTRATRILLGQRVRALREESNLTQEQLALMTGVGRSYLAKVEAGNRNATIDFMEKVALGLGVTLGQLFEGL